MTIYLLKTKQLLLVFAYKVNTAIYNDQQNIKKYWRTVIK
ncbi:MAG: hypothetical protein ACI94Y_001086 [Maribacter sp.]|jgi:hypothetical protein